MWWPQTVVHCRKQKLGWEGFCCDRLASWYLSTAFAGNHHELPWLSFPKKKIVNVCWPNHWKMEHSVHTKIHPPFHPSRDSREDADLLCISLQPLVLAKLNARCQLGSHLSPQECFEHTASPGPIINCQFQHILFELDTVGHTLLGCVAPTLTISRFPGGSASCKQWYSMGSPSAKDSMDSSDRRLFPRHWDQGSLWGQLLLSECL